MSAALSLQGVCTRYPAAWLQSGPVVLHEIDLEVAPGERVAILGPSGGGKSTLARLAVGLLRPSSGALCLFGADTATWSRHDWRSARSRIQLIPQDPSALMIPGVSLELALSESATIHGTPTEVIERIVTALSLGACLDSPPEALSGGELRRAGIARVLLARPSLLIADEPTAGLDLPLAGRLLDVLEEHLDASCAQVHITHDPRTARRTCTRLIIMAGGRILDDLDATAPAPTHELSRALLRASGWRDT